MNSPVVVVDIDGVLADVRHRVHFVEGKRRDWENFFAAAPEDPPLMEGMREIQRAQDEGLGVIYLTGRPERCRDSTQVWLRDHHFPDAPLYMRPDHDRRPARAFKVETLQRISADHEVVRFIDDDIAVVRVVRAAGYDVLHATWMSEEVDGVDEILQQVQENEGRT